VEYLASGKAVVASNVGEVKRMLGGVGILAKSGNHHSLAEGILQLLKDKTLRYNLGRFARRRAEERYNWQRSIASLLIAYKKLYSR
jgi:glycosyltransferase involved in cell wall biosynthesis